MSRALGSPPLKRHRPDTVRLVDAERTILDTIKSSKDVGIWMRDIKKAVTNLGPSLVTKSVNSLLAKKLIKEFVNINFKGSKQYMAVEFEPSKEVTGGDWYVDGKLDMDLIDMLKKLCEKFVKLHKVATVEGVHNELKKRRVTTFEISIKQVEEIMNYMVLDNELIEVKSNGLAECRSISVGTTCYRVASDAGAVGKVAKFGAFASIPCGACPRISLCTPDGVISPSTCVYYSKWLEILILE